MLDVETIKANGLCSGCGLCAGISQAATPAVVMRDAPSGYRRPEVVGKIGSEQARLIDAACPGARIEHLPETHAADYDPVWGPVIGVRLGWSSDSALRHNASSGGGLSALLLHLLQTGEADYVVQTAVSETSPLRNALFASTGRDDVFRAAGSRYAPSSPLEDIAARLDAPGRFAFVGKPCDVAGLRQLARLDPRVDEKVACMIAFMCAGVPGYGGTSALLAAMGMNDESEVTAFRYRGDGWPGYAKAQLADGRTLTMDYNTSWGAILNRHLQFRCKICPDGWHCDSAGNPTFGEHDGRSIVITRTRKGEALVQDAAQAGALIVEPASLGQVAQMQPYQARRKGLVRSRLLAMALAGKRRPRFSGLELARNADTLGFKGNLRSFLGTLRRLLTGREAG